MARGSNVFGPVLGLLLTAILLVLGGCFDEVCLSGPCGCEGIFEQLHTFPDTLTVELRQEPYTFDLQDPPLFRHTAGYQFSYQAGSGDIQVLGAFIGGSSGSILELYTRSAGLARVGISVTDDEGCEQTAGTGFWIRVIEPADSVDPRFM